MSPAPLSYVFEKMLDDLRAPTRYFGLSPFAYYRVASIGATALLGLIACFAAWTRIRKNETGVYALQAVLLVGSLGTFYFQHDVFHYATEMRPYALWNSLWFLALVLSTCRFAPGLQAGVLTLAALAATATVLQIFALGAAFLLVTRMEGSDWKTTLVGGLKIVLVPSIVALYFSMRTGQWAYETYGSWSGFLWFWVRSALGFWVISAAACALVWSKRPLWRYATGPTTLVVLLILGPVAFYAASQKGMVYSPRHYIYWGLAWPVALMVLSLAAPTVLAGRLRNLKVAGCILAMGLAAVNVTGGLKRRVKDYPPGRARPTFLEAGGEVRESLRAERPACIRYDPAIDPVMAFNLRLLAEWIPVAFPDARVSARELLIRQSGSVLVATLGESFSEDLAKIPIPP